MLDVGLAFLLVGLTIRIQVIARDTPDAVAQRVSYAIYRLAANLLLVLLVSFFIFGERIKWSTLLPTAEIKSVDKKGKAHSGD